MTSRGTVHRPSVYRSVAGAAILFYDRMSGLGVKVVFPAINNYQECFLCAVFTGRHCSVRVCVCVYLTTEPTCDKWNISNGRAAVVTLGCFVFACIFRCSLQIRAPKFMILTTETTQIAQSLQSLYWAEVLWQRLSRCAEVTFCTRPQPIPYACLAHAGL